MFDWQDKVSRAHLTCKASEKPIGFGETFFSVLRFEDGAFVRHDYSEEAWENDGIPDDILSWWRQRRPPPAQEESGPRLINHAVLLGIFRDLKDRGERPNQCLAWLLALLLVRAKKLRYHDISVEEDGTWMFIQERGGKQAYKIRDPEMNDEEQELLQDNIAKLFEGSVGDEDQEDENSPEDNGQLGSDKAASTESQEPTQHDADTETPSDETSVASEGSQEQSQSVNPGDEPEELQATEELEEKSS